MSLDLLAPAPITAQETSVPSPKQALYVDLAVVFLLVATAGILRFWNLGGVPYGLHGDEASTGLEARRILDEGSIGPYTPTALGQPAGPMYVAAVFEKVFGSGVATPRLPMALFGTATVGLGFFMLRSMFDRPAAYAGAFLLTFSAWLIFYNRTGYTVSAFPLSEVAAALAVWTATRRDAWPWSAVAGAIVGLGIYGYFAYPLFALGLALWVLIDFAVRRPHPIGASVRNLALMGIAAVVVVLPMQPYMTSDSIGYRHDRTGFSLFNTKKYKDAQGFEARLDVIKDNAVVTFERILFKKRPDASDGSGEWPALDPITLVFAGMGLAMSVYGILRKGDPRYALAPILIVLVSAGPIASIDGTNRRSLGLLVPVVMLASVGASFAWRELVSSRPRKVLYAGIAIALVLFGAYAFLNEKRYFEDARGTPNAIFSFSPELAEAAKLMRKQPEDTLVYFASERWSIHYQTLVYLAEDINGQDRSKEFGRRQDWEVDRAHPALIVLVGGYKNQADVIAGLYSDASRITGPPIKGSPAYVAFEVPQAPDAGR